MSIRIMVATLGIVSLLSGDRGLADEHDHNGSESAEKVIVYHKLSCGCCKAWIKYLQANDFEVESRVTEDVQVIKDELGVPGDKGGCHTAQINGYVIEGHVSAEDIRRLLRERPQGALGLTVPDMPPGSPGMEVAPGREVAYDTLLFYPTGKARVFSEFRPDAADDSEAQGDKDVIDGSAAN